MRHKSHREVKSLAQNITPASHRVGLREGALANFFHFKHYVHSSKYILVYPSKFKIEFHTEGSPAMYLIM